MNIKIMDSTLRDGAQSPGVSFTREEKKKIARMLAEAGVDELEVGTPAIGINEQGDIRAISAMNTGCRLTSWCRAKIEDLEDAARCNTGSVQISFPASPIHQTVMNRNEDWIFDHMGRILLFAGKEFDYVSVGAQDATRADRGFLKRFIEAASSSGACRVRIADTVGIATPFSTADLVKEMVKEPAASSKGVSIEFHAHNDLGMATANTLAAMESGADTVSVTINGLGERAGNAPLEQVVMVIALDEKLQCRVNPSSLMELCSYTAGASNRPIPADKPIIGASVFTHESGIHCYGMMKDSRSYEPFSSELLGRTSTILGGSGKGGRKAA